MATRKIQNVERDVATFYLWSIGICDVWIEFDNNPHDRDALQAHFKKLFECALFSCHLMGIGLPKVYFTESNSTFWNQDLGFLGFGFFRVWFF